MKLIIGFVLLCALLLKSPSIVMFVVHLMQFIRWKFVDVRKARENRKRGFKPFRPFGVKMFCGRQGSGKTTGLVWYLEGIRKAYPKAQIYSNFGYAHQTAPLQSLNDLLCYRNGEEGVVFAIDELQNEFSNAASKDFPETLLGTLTMQRKQRITVLTTSQIFSRVAKPLREQCYEVIECRTFGGRWTRLRSYDADDYNKVVDNPDPKLKFKLPKMWKRSFIQTDQLRDCFDTYEVVRRLSRSGFKEKVSSQLSP